jgi:hypothetical protein
MQKTICSPNLTLLWAATLVWMGGSIALAAEQSKAAAAPATRDAPATGPIDWRTVEHGSPIPHQMPVADADKAIDAGFSPQWVERSITKWPPSAQDPDLPAKQVLRIAKGNRRANDQWAHDVANRLRATLRINGDANVLRYARVFCGSEGCLCYYETPPESFALYGRVRSDLLHGLLDDGGWGHSLDIAPTNVDEVGSTGAWELIYILRGSAQN